jgi:hypothetical protein
MALVLANRVQETATANTTVSFTLLGAVTGFQTFSAGVGNSNTTFYAATDTLGNWEVGLGTYSTTGPTLTRTTIYASSNSGSAVTFSGTCTVFVTYPSGKSVNQDAGGSVNILTNVPNTTTNVGTLNVGDGTYNFAQLGQLATFASNEPVVNGVMIQNTSTSNTAYSSLQVGANNYNTGYFIELGTNSSTYDYAAAGYANNSVNQPNVNYIVANKADLGIVTWDANNIHFVQNASAATVDSMTLYASGGVSLGGNPDPGLGTLYANNVYLGFNQITAAAGTTVLTNASLAWQQVVGTTTQTIQLPDATTLYKGLAFTIANSATGLVTITDNASATVDTLVTGSTSVLVLTANGTSAGTWVAYSYLPSSYNFNTSSADFGGATISNATWNGTAIPSGYGGTGLTTFTGANNALYSTSASALAAGTLPVAAGGTGVTASSGANSVMIRDANQNVAVNRLNQSNTSTASAGGTTTLTAASSYSQTLTGTLAQTYKMPDATALTTGVAFVFNNNSTGLLTLQNNASATIGTITAGGAVELVLLDNSTAAGVWDVHGYIPENVTWGTNALALGSTVITGGTWNGGTVTSGYGGTGLTTFTAANNAIYSTSSSALTAGTLPVLAGGTGTTTPSLVAGTNVTVTGTWPNQTIATGVRVVAIADSSTVSINADTTDIATQANTQATGTLTISAPTGTPVNGQKLIFRLLSTNVQTFSWNAAFQGSTDLALPTASTGSSKYDYMGFIWNSTNSKWQLLARNMGF